jgi:translation elongation factor EF-Tu-like GTPase
MAKAIFERNKPHFQPIVMDECLHFAIRDGGRSVVAGVVAKITK